MTKVIVIMKNLLYKNLQANCGSSITNYEFQSIFFELDNDKCGIQSFKTWSSYVSLYGAMSEPHRKSQVRGIVIQTYIFKSNQESAVWCTTQF